MIFFLYFPEKVKAILKCGIEDVDIFPSPNIVIRGILFLSLIINHDADKYTRIPIVPILFLL